MNAILLETDLSIDVPTPHRAALRARLATGRSTEQYVGQREGGLVRIVGGRLSRATQVEPDARTILGTLVLDLATQDGLDAGPMLDHALRHLTNRVTRDHWTISVVELLAV